MPAKSFPRQTWSAPHLPMSKTKKSPELSKASQPATQAEPKVKSHAARETVESIVIAFVLAFLFRTFEAEAFVIPTGSMAPTLMGRHKDVDCPKCGYRYQVSASEEESEDPQRRPPSDCIAGMCPMCHYVLPMRPNLELPQGVPELRDANIPLQPSYNGDRILVNKYTYTFSDPKRWDVVVFKFPGDAKVNYIKRLVGLPGEKLQIYQGDVFLAKNGASEEKEGASDKDFEIIRKPPDKILAMRQLVHDTNFDPSELDAAGWPLRWHSPDGSGANTWQVEKTVAGKNVRQRYHVEAADGADSWLRYEHLLPTYDVWQQVADSKPLGVNDANRARWRRLITDANPYDARLDRNRINNNLMVDWLKWGMHWVGDLMVEADVEIDAAKGELLLDLVEGGRHFGCRVDLTSGEATLSATGAPDFKPHAKTGLTSAGKHHIAFSNIDDQLLLWVDGKLVSFDAETAYDASRVFGDRHKLLPQTSDTDLGDLAPAGIGARGAKLAVSRLKVWRDIYYIADDWRTNSGREPVYDFPHPFDPQLLELASNPRLWNRYAERKQVDFSLNNEQLFVMGDNSAESSDARLWVNSDRGKPGGPYLERRLLIGKALCVYWPHSWNRIPGTPIPFPLFPNVADMRLVR
jgi:signal peptidase I